ncbi:MAG: hypothetical protein HPKKFMNG_02768 [Planctomycetes bacterium]|nr:hypothetical protein [Planctomycetota bacterium]
MGAGEHAIAYAGTALGGLVGQGAGVAAVRGQQHARALEVFVEGVKDLADLPVGIGLLGPAVVAEQGYGAFVVVLVTAAMPGVIEEQGVALSGFGEQFIELLHQGLLGGVGILDEDDPVFLHAALLQGVDHDLVNAAFVGPGTELFVLPVEDARGKDPGLLGFKDISGMEGHEAEQRQQRVDFHGIPWMARANASTAEPGVQPSGGIPSVGRSVLHSEFTG